KSIALATVTHDNGRPASLVVVLGRKLVQVAPEDVYGDPEKPFRGIYELGRLTPASGDWRSMASPPPAGAATVVIVDRGTPAAGPTALAPLGDRCIGFLGTHDRVTAAVIPEPCPAAARSSEDVELGIWVDQSKIVVGVSRLDEITDVATRALLEAALQERKA